MNSKVKGVGAKIKRGISSLMKNDNAGIAIVLVMLCVVTTIVNPAFVSKLNMVNLLRKIAQVGFIAVGMTFVMIGGGIDLSAGKVAGLGGICFGVMATSGMPVALAILVTVIIGGIFGAFNGFFVAKVKIPPFIVTLGSMYIAEGIVNVLSSGKPIYPLPETFLYIFDGISVIGIPLVVFMVIALAIAMHYLLSHTTYGRSITASGGNEKAATTAGIDVKKTKAISYIILGGLAAFTGILIAARLSTALPASGTGWELTAIAAAVIGGTSVSGGKGSIVGTMIGASIMSVLDISMTMMKINVNYQNIIVGAIIIGAVVLDLLKRRSK